MIIQAFNQSSVQIELRSAFVYFWEMKFIKFLQAAY